LEPNGEGGVTGAPPVNKHIPMIYKCNSRENRLKLLAGLIDSDGNLTGNEFEFTQTIYNYYIHPQWNDFGSRTLYMKLLFVDYDLGFCIIELIGEWNDAIENDVMTLRRDVTDLLQKQGITKFILIAENVLNFHSSDDSYYEEWHESVADEGGWVVIVNLPIQSQYDFKKARLTNYVALLDFPQWRTLKPELVFNQVDDWMIRQLE
jgi:hypothetical protein